MMTTDRTAKPFSKPSGDRQMKPIIVACFAAFAAVTGPAAAQDAFPRGQWENADGDVQIEIAPCDSRSLDLCGVIVRDSRPGPAANPPLHRAVTGLRFSKKAWRGQIVDGDLKLAFRMKASGDDTAQVRMCFGGIACETETWRRVGEIVPLTLATPR